jgi:rod shape determining protein RodA
VIRENVDSTSTRALTVTARVLGTLRMDGPLVLGLAAIALVGLLVLYSASGGNWSVVLRGSVRLLLGSFLMLLLAQIRPSLLLRASPWLYGFGLILLLAVEVAGDVGKGAQRWLELGFMRFQPSEIMKLAVPMACAWWLHERPIPPSVPNLLALAALIVVPTALVMIQPDLGTSLLIAMAGLAVVFLAGLSLRVIISLMFGALAAAWAGWEFLLRDYQRQRVLTFLDPEADPLGSGYHIIQSTIAIGSGGIFGKGYLRGSQSQLVFLPERSTDFVFAVIGEEFGLFGILVVLGLYLFVVARALLLANQMKDTYARLLAGSFAALFFIYVFINAGMVSGLLPVVGVPLPLISYGGTSMVTLLAGFGILMSLYANRKLAA